MSIKIKYLNIISFGHFENLTIDFTDGFNLIYGANESGKSTIRAFIEGLLYGFDEGKKVKRFSSKQKKYMPKSSYKYGGFGIFDKDGVSYRISRDFFTGKYEIYDMDRRESLVVVESNYNYPGEFLLGIDYSLYQNLISNYQFQESTNVARSKIKEFFINQGDYNFSVSEALTYLDQELAKIGTERAYSKEYAITKSEIESLKEEIKELQVLRESYYLDYKKLDDLRLEIGKKKKELVRLREKRDGYRLSKASQNLAELRIYQEKLAVVNKDLLKIGQVRERETDFQNPEQRSVKNLALLATSLLLLVLSISLEKYYLLPLALLIGLIFYFALSQNKNLLPEKSKTQYNDREKQNYMALLSEKEKIEEIIEILQGQELADKTYDTNFDSHIDIRKLDARIEKIEKSLEDLNQKQLSLAKRFAFLEDKLGKEVILIDRLNEEEAKFKELEKEIAAIKLAKDVIRDISQGPRSSSKAFEEAVNEIIRNISKESYEKVIYEDDLSPKIITKDGQMLDFDMLSTGFIDQLAFAMKYTVNANIDSFMVFDDAFINYDKNRLRASLFYLLDLASFRQIIYLTCHDREEEILAAEGIDFNLIHLEDL